MATPLPQPIRKRYDPNAQSESEENPLGVSESDDEANNGKKNPLKNWAAKKLNGQV